MLVVIVCKVDGISTVFHIISSVLHNICSFPFFLFEIISNIINLIDITDSKDIVLHFHLKYMKIY